ncbi:tRNA (adenosine(37)-N6)-dimethylallyltransferase MiaA [Candidatus Nanopelagicales bacterium]|nr:tRNA (adenosine(37)-N6)-dimethylallyltransferase MiaA [Candidatus Nanopelagicales bacterium]
MSALIAIVGPTASGKTALAVQVAKALDGEVVGTDSMQAYRGMDIGTASPTVDEQQGVPHHMIDVWDVAQAVSVVEFRDRARLAIDSILDRGKVPVVVGGSGLYVRAVLEEMDFPTTDPNVRQRWDERLKQVGATALHSELADIDPDAAANIEINNGRRIVRALEVIELTGEPFIARLPDPVDRYSTTRFGLRIDREALDERIARRVDAMWDAGFVDEVRRLEADGLRSAPTAAAALGYGPILRFLSGETSESEAREQIVNDTRKFARRQQRWFARDGRIDWRDYNDVTLADSIVAAVTST